MSTFPPNSTSAADSYRPEFDIGYQHAADIKRACTITSMGFISIVVIALIISTHNTNCRKSVAQKNSKASGRFLFISFILALLLFYICSILCVYMMFNIEQITTNDIWTPLLISTKVLYQCGRLVTEMYFIARLYFVFRNSASFVNKWAFVVLIILLILSFICGVTGTFTGSLHVFPFYPGTNQIHPPQMFAFISGCIGCIVAGVVIYLFIKMLYEINIQTAMHSNNEQMLRTISKHTLLGVIGLASTFVLYCVVIVEWIFDLIPDPIAFRCIATLDGAINVIVMYLGFSWSSPVYKKACWVCSEGIMKCCMRCTQQSVRKWTEQETVQAKPSSNE